MSETAFSQYSSSTRAMFTERISLGLVRKCSISGRRTKRIRQAVPAFSSVSARNVQ